MKKRTIARAATSVAAAAGIAAAGIVAAGPANAQVPFDLRIEGGVNCSFGEPGQPWSNFWSMHRWMKVTNDGPYDAPNVLLQEIAGQQRFAPVLKPRESLFIETRWAGCWPSSISGYTHSSLIDPLHNNAGIWANVQFRDAPAPEETPGG
ncbi:hypothetical protein [Rhodococcus sp. HNM0569]|uniref:hypothetical protein n=1 Tax=Rhodococcus sp. HNM0569 TaxID=2716340 RepID=UPI00146E3A61|nr:hypothetical protein [Rhodococcus sp. HNM0569]NLU84994.1 hypothetical protein [Rhodococcus sp. HNM0569]